jgi:hypothetical protein
MSGGGARLSGRLRPPARRGNGAIGGALDRESPLADRSPSTGEVACHKGEARTDAPTKVPLRLPRLGEIGAEKVSSHAITATTMRQYCQEGVTSPGYGEVRQTSRVADKHTPEDLLMAQRARAWVRKEQADLGLSQNAMATKLGLKSGTFSRYMTSNRLPPIGFILRIRHRLHVDAKLLLDSDPVQRRNPNKEPAPSSQSAGT